MLPSKPFKYTALGLQWMGNASLHNTMEKEHQLYQQMYNNTEMVDSDNSKNKHTSTFSERDFLDC